MRKRILKIIPAVLLAASSAGASDSGPPGLFRLAPSAASLGRGACGVSSADTELFTVNPAAIGGLRNWSLAAGYGTADTGTDRSAAFALPFSRGVLGLAGRYVSLDGAYAFQSDLGAARELYPGFYLGAALHATVTGIDEERVAYGALSAGLLVRTGPAGPRWKGFGVYGMDMGASLRRGAARGDSAEAGDYDQASAGLGLTLYRSGMISTTLFGEASAPGHIDELSVKTGIESALYDFFTVRAGWILRDGYQCGRYTLGAGLKVDALDLRGALDYAVLFGDGYGETHYLGMTVAWGGPDMDPPEISVAADCRAFSPDYDGRQDRVVFRLQGRDRSDIKGWFFQVLDGQGRVIREFRHRGSGRRRSLSPLALVRSLVESREGRVIPAELSWDGIDESGRAHPDGEYAYAFVVWDEHDNISSARKGRVRIDTAVPEASMKLQGERSTLTAGGSIEVELKVREKNDDRVSLTVRDEDGKAVRRAAWSARETPLRFSWDGGDGKGKPVKPGRYSLHLEAVDAAGNEVARELHNIIVDPAAFPLDVASSADYYSPALKLPLRFTPGLPKGTGFSAWKLVLGEEDAPARIISGTTVPGVIEWDGLTDKGKVFRDGAALYRFEASLSSGVVLSSPWKLVVVDATPPRPALTADSKYFSPEGDFIDDRMIFRLVSDEEYGTERWEMNIYAGTGALCHRVSGVGEPPRRVAWDGRGKGGVSPFSMETFTAELVALDRAGNRAVSPKLAFSTDIMLLPWQGMLRVTFADSSNAARLRSEAKLNRTLERLADVLGDYPGYRMEIEAHSDFEGDDHINLMATEKKAKYVRDFLARSGFGDRVISFRGMGETRPLYGEEAGADRKKNGRIEIFLVPKAD